jgi:hypothetical protein
MQSQKELVNYKYTQTNCNQEIEQVIYFPPEAHFPPSKTTSYHTSPRLRGIFLELESPMSLGSYQL